MTDTSTEAVVAPAATDTPSAPSPAQAVGKADEQKNGQVEDAPGGWPVAPLALSGANATVSTIAAAGLAGGPIAAAVAATGIVVVGTLASYRSRNPRPKQAARRAAARTAARQHAARHHSGGLNTTGRKASSAGGRTAGGSGKVPGQKRRGAGQGRSGAGQHRAPASVNKPAGVAARALSKAGQVRALRKAQKQAGGSRAQKREQTSAARRAVADARRNTPKPSANKPGGGKARAGAGGVAGRMLGGAGRKARAVKQAAIAKQRARRDAATARKVSAGRSNVRKAPARQAARKALRRSAARFHGRRALAALLALPVGLLGFLASPLGRRLGLSWLVHPGRRLYRRLTGAAREERAERDTAIREEQASAEDAAEQEAAKDVTDGLGERVERPAGPVPNSTDHTSLTSEGEHVSGFQFEEHAAEMEQAAQSYDPEDAMEILAMVESLPAALTSVANVMKTLAERADSEFPLEKEVADGFNDIFGALMSAVAVAEDMGPLFRQAHEQDIARHEDPRNGPEAEKGWNV
ncbi:hypothetical protein [Streptomyces sp. WMMC940]|uniref:hypothetical protein n=1 Tax=Streptomyces sp. WMMC940 TaxID=3015153 RepID=UPI0022B65B5B|nr:hypothetical protein [Streptomyces sp. WMMC940]MCZ7458894.1 hypothetical protein [Streptomyces sp. WMMC940]MCZ7462408.1 hypothetical protein [Streptomyces sp. WMMC940]